MKTQVITALIIAAATGTVMAQQQDEGRGFRGNRNGSNVTQRAQHQMEIERDAAAPAPRRERRQAVAPEYIEETVPAAPEEGRGPRARQGRPVEGQGFSTPAEREQAPRQGRGNGQGRAMRPMADEAPVAPQGRPQQERGLGRGRPAFEEGAAPTEGRGPRARQGRPAVEERPVAPVEREQAPRQGRGNGQGRAMRPMADEAPVAPQDRPQFRARRSQ